MYWGLSSVERMDIPPTPAAEVLFKRTPSTQLRREVFSREKRYQKCGTIHYLNYDTLKGYFKSQYMRDSIFR